MKRLFPALGVSVFFAHGAMGASVPASQPKYPIKSIRMIGPYAAGGGADVMALWNSEIGKLLRTAEMKDRMTALGIDIAGGPNRAHRTDPASLRCCIGTGRRRRAH